MAKRILVVDDDESILEVVQIVLESEGYEVQTATNSSFLQQLASQPVRPDLILLDVLLSGEDGREISQQLKADTQLQHIPVIMLSAHSEASKMANIGGADAFLEKPFDVDVLLDTVQRYISDN
ncbi:MAG TPA: response regulator [Ktedonobacter sp.]|nr:response regulator [Ktedonobacter sp.]